MNFRKFILSLFFPLMHDLAKVERLLLNNQPEAALAHLEKLSGLSNGDYTDLTQLRAKLVAWLNRNSQLNAAMYMPALVGALGVLRRHHHSLLVLESYLGLEAHHYDSPEILAVQLNQRLDGLPPDLQFQVLWVLIGVLGVLGRESEALALIRYDLGLAEESDNAIDAEARHKQRVQLFTERVRRRLGELMPDSVALYINFLALNLDELGVAAEGIRALEQPLDLHDADYETGGKLKEKLQTWCDTMQSPLAGIFSLITLAGALEQGGMPHKSLAIMEWCFRIEPADYEDVEHLAQKWHNRMEQLPVDTAATFWRLWVSVLANAGRNPRRDALAIIEADSGLRVQIDQNLEQIAVKMRHRLQVLQIDTQSAYVFSLIDELSKLRERNFALAITDWYIRTYENFWTLPETRDPGITHVIPLLVFWMRHHARVDREFTLQVCRQAVVYLRQGLSQQGVKFADRKKFIEYINDLRRTILDAGYFWISEITEIAEATELRQQVQLWDLELTQRILLERFLLEPVEPASATVAPIKDRWPFREDDVALSPTLPETHFTAASDSAEPPQRNTVSHTYPELYTQARQLIETGVTESLVANALGKTSLLLRATFDAEGKLFWSAVKSDGRRVWIAASGSGRPNDLWVLREATAKHDFRVRLAWIRASWQRRELRQQLQQVLAALQPDRRLSPQALLDLLGQIHGDLQKPGFEHVYKLWLLCCSRLGQPPQQPEAYARWADTEAERLRLHLILITVKPDQPAVLLEKATTDYITEVAALWNLDALHAVLTPDTDVIVQVDDALHAAPIPYLPVGGQPLFQQIRSIRSTYSVLLNILQQAAVPGFQPPETDRARMLVVSWFDDTSTEDALAIAKQLHQGQWALAKHYDLDYYGAADDPSGSIGVISAALDAYRSFKVMTISGHGDHVAAGVKLQDDELWKGNGCDLSQVELLLMVSCSIGRANQTGDLDVEGFCVQLAVHRALSVVACRWPVSGRESAAFAKEIVNQYLQLCNQIAGEHGTAECLRACALIVARKAFYTKNAEVMIGKGISLNTAAAFELYGLG